MDVFKLAWRNVWRNRRRTLVTIAAMTFALFVMILYSSLLQGYLRDMERNIVDLEVGDIQIFAGDYRENPSLYTRIEDPEALLEPLAQAGFPASARLLGFGLAAADEASAGASFRGIDIERDARVSRIHEEIAEGRWLDPADPRGVVLGKRLARTLAVKVGDELLVLSQGADGSMAYDLYEVRGTLRSMSAAVDRTGVFMTEESFRELMVVPAGAHQIIVRRPVGLSLPAAALKVSGVASTLDVRTWKQLMPTLASMLESARAAILAIFLIVYIAIAILILNAMLMAVFERVREFGVLKALGASPLEVLVLILLESAIQAGIAIACGLALSLPALYYFSTEGFNIASLAGVTVMGVAMNPIWRGVVSPETFTGPVGLLVLIVAVAVLFPAFKAALIRPVEAMRHQ
ncbi:MAG: ABC transporter permease [Myxococcales bacterium]|nr:ABC transporter permease [Myxococcales bacterium]